MARSICWGVRGGSTEIVGTSSGTAPYDWSCSDSPAACSLVRGTRTRQPNSGLFSNHDRRSRVPTASPTTISAGSAMPACLRSAASLPSEDTTVYCSVVVPLWVTATGVVSGLPPAMRALPMATASVMPL